MMFKACSKEGKRRSLFTVLLMCTVILSIKTCKKNIYIKHRASCKFSCTMTAKLMSLSMAKGLLSVSILAPKGKKAEKNLFSVYMNETS